MLYKLADALADIAAEPNQAVRPALWQPLHDAIVEFGDKDQISLALDAWPNHEPSPNVIINLREDAALENVVKMLLETADPPKLRRLSQELAARGFAGVQLQIRIAVIDHLHSDYVAHGRVKDVPKNDPGLWSRARACMGSLFAGGSTALDSLSAIPPPGFSLLKIPSEVCSLCGITVDGVDVSAP